MVIPVWCIETLSNLTNNSPKCQLSTISNISNKECVPIDASDFTYFRLQPFSQ